MPEKRLLRPGFPGFPPVFHGQIAQATGGVSGETISYQYDVLKRLTSASSSPISGSTPTAWSQSYSYDGFGNLTGKGSGATIPVNSGTNQLENQTGVLSGVSYDSNGNLLSVTKAGASALTMTYDGSNRVHSATVGSGTEYYGYDPGGHRVYRKLTNGTEEWTLYGLQGEKLGTFSMVLTCSDWTDPTTCDYEPAVQTTDIWFGSKLVWSGTGSGSGSGPDFTDHLGTNRANGARFYPYGDEITSTGNDHVKFATYERSSVTGLDYASARYYASTYGRFTSVDPMGKSAHARNPGSWNRYAYVGGDPVNRFDPRGLCIEDSEGGFWDTSDDDDDASDWGPGDCEQNPEWLSMADGVDYTVMLNGGPYIPGGGYVSVTDMAYCVPYDPTSADLPGCMTGPSEEELEEVAEEQCNQELNSEFAALQTSIDNEIAKEFTPANNISSLAIKDAIVLGYQGYTGSLVTELGVDGMITTAIGGAAFGTGLGVIIGASAAIVTLPLNSSIESLTMGFVNQMLSGVHALVTPNCSFPFTPAM